MKMDKDNFSKL